MSNCISRLTVEGDAWERRDRCRQEEEAEKLEVAEVEAFRRSKQNIKLDQQDGRRESPHHSNQEEYILEGTVHPSSPVYGQLQSPRTINACVPSQDQDTTTTRQAGRDQQEESNLVEGEASLPSIHHVHKIAHRSSGI